MRVVKCFTITIILAVLGFVAFASPALALPTVYSGYDTGSTSLATSPNATAAAAAFDLATGPLSLIDFESSLPAGVTFSLGIVGVDTAVCATPDLHCYATSPTNVLRNNGTTFTFATPIDSLGAYWTGWQHSGQTLTLGYLDGTSKVLNMPAGLSWGGTLFFGFTDFGASITSIQYTAGSPTTDAVGIDDVRYGSASVPEPSTILLFSSGMAGLVVWRYRKLRTPSVT